MKRGVYFLLPILFFSFQSSLSPAAQPPMDGLLIADLERIPVVLETDVGRQESPMKGQIAIRRSLDRQGQVTLEVQSFNLMIASVKTRQGRGETGQIALNLTRPIQTTADPVREVDNFKLRVSLTAHYPLITALRGYRRADRTQEDDYPVLTEEFIGSFQGQLVPPREGTNQDRGSLALQGDIILGQEFILGVVRRIGINVRINFTTILVRLCPNGHFAFTRTLCVQPAYVRSGSGDSTLDQQNYFADQLNNANAIWARCCVRFEEAPAVFVNNADLQVITTNDGLTSTEEADLLEEVNNDDCVEVYIIESNDPESAHGGGATWGSGTAEAKIISAANNPPINQRHLAHELGHALGLCHPGTGCTAPRADGTAGSLLEPSGFFADNPDVLRQDECDNISNPLLRSGFPLCCQNPDA
jgi:hypothetical protein